MSLADICFDFDGISGHGRGMSNPTAAYIREVARTGQSADAQLRTIGAASHDPAVEAIYQDGPSTTGKRARWPGRDAMLRDAGTRFSILLVTSLATLGRSLSDLITTLDFLHQRGVTVRVVDDGQNSGHAVEALLSSISLLAEARADLHREAVTAGKLRARSKGVQFGRPRIEPHKLERVRQLLAEGGGIRATARIAGVSAATVMRVKARRSSIDMTSAM